VYPEEFRQAHGGDLSDTTEDLVQATISRQGRAGMLMKIPGLFFDLALRAVAEHWHDAQRDLRYALRLLMSAPGFTIAAVLCLALGTGLTSAMYAQVQSTVLADIPGGVDDPDTLIRVHRPPSFPVFEQLRDGAATVVRLAGYVGVVPVTFDKGDGSERRRIWGHLATPDYFDVLGVGPAVGRLFGPEERQPGATTVVISERLWRRQFGAEETIVGRSIRINGQLVTVVGVAAPRFAGASPMTAAAELWIPTTAATRIAPELAALADRRSQTVEVVGRLLPGVSSVRAEQVLEAIADRVEPVFDDARATNEPRVRLLPGGRMFAIRNEDLPRAIGFPLVLVLLVLLMACGNVANMVLARGAWRTRELSVRLALGASRGRVVRQLMTESLVLSVLGWIAGGVVALWLLSFFERLRPVLPDYVQYDVQFHWGAFIAAGFAATVSTVSFSLAPSIRATRQDIQAALKPNAPSGLHGFRRLGLRNLVVFQQVALSVVLLLLTGFVVVGWTRSASIDLGFQPAQLYFLNVDPIRDGRSPAEAAQVVDRIQQRLQTTMGVQSVSLAQTVPLAMTGAEVVMNARTDLAAGTRALGTMRVDRVGVGFFETVGTPLVRGRSFRQGEQANESRVVIVNETLAASVWPGLDPVGQTLKVGDATWEAIGVVGNIRSAFPLAPTFPGV
jgi:predicted permease